MLIQDLALILLVSGFTAFIFHRLDQPKVIGYVLAGLILGPYTPPFTLIHDEQVIRTLGDIGVVFLMFSLGLDFNIRRLRSVGATALITAVLDVGVMLWLGYMLGRFLGWPPVTSLFLGAILCDSSSSILAKVLHEMGHTSERYAGVMIGITLVEDLLAVVLIVILTGVAFTGSVQTGLLMGRLWNLLLFLAMLIVFGLLTVPRMLNHIFHFRNDELLIVTLVGLCFGVALMAVKMELSLALGAVLIGAIASESNARQRIVALIDPLRHVFSAVFFVTIGLQLDPSALWHSLPVILAASLLVIVGKFAMNNIGVLLMGHSLDTAVRVGAGMAQVGEFAFIISALALSQGIGGDTVYQIGVGVAVFTTVLSPYLLRAGNRLAAYVNRCECGQRWSTRFRFYGQWIEQLGRERTNSAVRRIVRRSLITIAINLLLIAAIFGVGNYADNLLKQYGIALLQNPGLTSAGVWMGCVLACLAFYQTIVRKVEALAMILTESALPSTLKGGWVRPVRQFVTGMIVLATMAGLFLMTAILSSTMMPSGQVFLLLAAVALVIGLWARRRITRMYGRAQMALEGMLSEDKTRPEKKGVEPALPEWASGVLVESLDLEAQYAAAFERKTLRDLNLRSRTGVTLIAVERKGQRMANPNPNHVFLPGDRLFLLGTAEQIQSARQVLAASEAVA